MKRRLACALMVAMAVTLSACGFQLRGSNNRASLPFRAIYLAFPDTSALGNELKRYIRASGETTIAMEPKTAQAIVELLSETRERVVLSKNTQGRERERSLIYKIRLRVKDNKEQELLAPTEIALKRNLSFNEEQAIAKEKEEELLYRDMQSDMVQQILRRLAALKPA